jgi:hypothetical protein
MNLFLKEIDANLFNRDNAEIFSTCMTFLEYTCQVSKAYVCF